MYRLQTFRAEFRHGGRSPDRGTEDDAGSRVGGHENNDRLTRLFATLQPDCTLSVATIHSMSQLFSRFPRPTSHLHSTNHDTVQCKHCTATLPQFNDIIYTICQQPPYHECCIIPLRPLSQLDTCTHNDSASRRTPIFSQLPYPDFLQQS